MRLSSDPESETRYDMPKKLFYINVSVPTYL